MEYNESMVQPDRYLILLSGLPGCGKTTLAHRLAKDLRIPLFAKDHLQSALRRQGLASRSGAEGYRMILDLAEAQLSLGVSVILDAVFPKVGFRREAEEIAHCHGAMLRPIYCYCSDEALWQERMTGREQLVPDWSPVGWEEVVRLRGDFQAWQPKEALFLDAVRPVEENFVQAKTWIVQLGHPGGS